MTIEEPRFLVDVSLQRLGRWLRAAGYNTEFAQESDSEYYRLRQAINEGRLLITRDPKLTELRRAAGTVILLECDNLEDCAEELCAHISIDWEHNPFTRCTACNTELAASNEQNQYCPGCKQILWDGTHLTRMRNHLDNWHRKYTR